MIHVMVTLSDWMYRSVVSESVLTLHRDYFGLRKPLERRVYEIARKHCGRQAEWRIGLETLLKKSGSTSPRRVFRKMIRDMAAEDGLPDYSLALDETDVVLVRARGRLGRGGGGGARGSAPDIHERVREVAPGYDPYWLEAEWLRIWAASGRPRLTSPEAAFLAFARARARAQARCAERMFRARNIVRARAAAISSTVSRPVGVAAERVGDGLERAAALPSAARVRMRAPSAVNVLGEGAAAAGPAGGRAVGGVGVVVAPVGPGHQHRVGVGGGLGRVGVVDGGDARARRRGRGRSARVSWVGKYHAEDRRGAVVHAVVGEDADVDPGGADAGCPSEMREGLVPVDLDAGAARRPRRARCAPARGRPAAGATRS